MVVSPSYLERYLRGEHEQVWADLVAFGEQVSEEPLATDARAVAQETMRRVRHNIVALIPRWRALGYEFGHGWAVGRGALTEAEAAEMDRDELPIEPPTDDIVEQIAELERRAGRLPLSLQAFYEVVGGTNFVGAHPAWVSMGLRYDLLDPLQVLSARAVLQLDDWNRWSDDRQEDGTCEAPIAPDAYFKYLYSGGGPYTIPLRGLVADTPLLYEWHHTTFVDYLRISLRWAGLPGLERMGPMTEAVSPDLPTLTHDLLPI